MKSLQTVKFVELTVVLAIETYQDEELSPLCAMDLVHFCDDATILGCSERDLTITYKDEENK